MITDADKVAVVTHMHPDGDAIGSSLGLLRYLQAAGKQAVIILHDKYPDSLAFMVGDDADSIIVHEEKPGEAAAAINSADLLFCLDMNSFSRAEKMQRILEDCTCRRVLIDHHLNPDRKCFSLCFSETETSSTAELLYHILMEMPDIRHDAGRLPSVTTTALMTGMTTDTNNFANSVFPTTLAMASSLLGAGVDRDFILDNIFNSYKESRIRLMGYLLDRCLHITDDGVAYMILEKNAISKFGIQDGDTEGFVNIPLAIGRVRMSIFLKQDKDRFRVSVRSKKGTSANLCAAEFFNGGGHELASGGKLMIPDDVSCAADAAAYIERVTHIFFNR